MSRFLPASRLRRSREFTRVFAQGQRRHNANFVVIAASNNLQKPRLGLAISRKRARRAVDRNRIKRIVRESFRNHAHSLPDVDIVVLARQATHETRNDKLFASLEWHWRQIDRNHADCEPD